MTPTDAILAAMIRHADFIGPSPEGGAFLLVEAPNDLLRRLELLDADTIDDEDFVETDGNTDDEDDDPGGGDVNDTGEMDFEGEPSAGESGFGPWMVNSKAVYSRRRIDPIVAFAEDLSRAAEGDGPGLGGLASYWPASAGMMRHLVENGIGDRRAAALFGVHPVTYRGRRRRFLDTGDVARGDADPSVDPSEFGLDPDARWPASAAFQDDPAASRVDGRRIGPRPITHVESVSTTALAAL